MFTDYTKQPVGVDVHDTDDPITRPRTQRVFVNLDHRIDGVRVTWEPVIDISPFAPTPEVNHPLL